jgi:hypothetical protein
VNHFHATVTCYAITGIARDASVLVLGFDDENVSPGIVLRVSVDGVKKSVTAVDVERKGLMHGGGQCDDMKILLAIRCAALTLDICIRRKPIREDEEVARGFREHGRIPNVGSPLLSDFFISQRNAIHGTGGQSKVQDHVRGWK